MSGHPTDHKQHPYHLVDPSPWPLMGAASVFTMALGGVIYMHEKSLWLLLAGTILVLATMGVWWRDVVREGGAPNHHTHEVRIGLREGMALFIASEVMFFVAFFWAFFHNALRVNPQITQWPPEGIVPLETWSLPFWNTLILLGSGATLMWGMRGFLKQGNRRRLVNGLALSIVLGFLFLALQIYEYGHAAFAFRQGIYPSVFYMATGFHGFHVLVGASFLTVCLFRARAGHFQPERHVGLQAAEWYWHFVDIVWLFLFSWVYWWGGG
ncbi:Cytochrome c oxidase subunit III [Rhodospirillaceae bacterium LM-1]|nr:Cytochrome c oxidase subunit III [Rhodospirillaceae bacterium LM-1]